MKTCKTCGATIDELAVFPGGICLACHEKRFNAEVARNGGILPRPDFTAAINRMERTFHERKGTGRFIELSQPEER